MKIQEPLSKENFWNDMMSKFPNSMRSFCAWIDQYKARVGWNDIFSSNESTDQRHSSKYKFHEIPYEMQQGIWIAYAEETLNKLFEQPEYIFYCGDLRDDIERVFMEIEPILI